jgi:hypothetical protein
VGSNRLLMLVVAQLTTFAAGELGPAVIYAARAAWDGPGKARGASGGNCVSPAADSSQRAVKRVCLPGYISTPVAFRQDYG